MSVRQRSSKGLEYLGSYTLGEVRSNNRGYYGSDFVQAEGAYWMNAYEPEWNYGPAFFDARHNFVLSANYELPVGPGRSAAVNALLGGWRISGAFQARTGFPITVIDGRGSSLQAVRGNERPNCIGNPIPSDQNIDHWLDINAFGRAPQGTWGNCGVGVARAPGFRSVIAALSKRVNAGGQRGVEFRIEAFNLFNTPNFSPPARDIGVPNTFGTITNTVIGGRIVELVLKFFF